MSESLEAAHIDRFQGVSFDHPQNGLLFRKDLHALFDAGLLGIEPGSLLVRFSDLALEWEEYKKLDGRALTKPSPPNDSYTPSEAALERRWRSFSTQQLAVEPSDPMTVVRPKVRHK